MHEDETVLSEVHLGTDCSRVVSNPGSQKLYNVLQSRFEFRLPQDVTRPNNTASVCFDTSRKRKREECIDRCDAVLDKSSDVKVSMTTVTIDTDDDGDLILERDDTTKHDVIIIEHAMDTALKDVGLQVWSGCLLLCDYIIDRRDEFSRSSCVLELGAGTGLASCVAAMFNNNIYCTDVDEGILKQCSRNLETNIHSSDVSSCKVRQLDWTKSLFDQCGNNSSVFDLSNDDLTEILSCPLIIASDVVYSDKLTEAFFQTVQMIMLSGPAITKTLIISLEKRLCFTLADLTVSCPAYNKFSSLLQRLVTGEILSDESSSRDLTLVANDRKFTMEQIHNTPQYFNYESSQYLELWRITMDCL